MSKEHLTGLREKISQRHVARAGRISSTSPNGQRLNVAASPKPQRPPRAKAIAGQPGSHGSRYGDIRATGPGHPSVNRRTGKPHEHKREIARRLARAKP